MTQQEERALVRQAFIAVGCLVVAMFLAASFVLGSLT
jgi:hypothetical protein